MASIMLIRNQKLDQEELSRLPFPCVPVINGITTIVYAELGELSLREQFKLIYLLGNRIPNAEIVYHDPSAPLPAGASLGQSNPPRYAYTSAPTQNDETKEYSEEIIDAESFVESDSFEEEEGEETAVEETKGYWQMIEEKQYEDAINFIKEIPQQDWDYSSRIKILALLDSDEPEQVSFACRVIQTLKWRTNVVRVRRLFHHNSPSVRIAALRVIGEFAGVSLLPSIHLLINDSDPEVSQIAKKTYQKVSQR
jgi:hypothetical protein